MHAFQIAAHEVRFIDGLARSADLDTAVLLTGMGLRADLLQDPQTDHLSLADYAKFMQHIAVKTGDETCAASSRHLMTGTTNYLLRGLACPEPMIHVLKALADGYNFAHGGPFNGVRLSSKSLCYSIDDRGFPYAPNQRAEDCATLIESILVSLHLFFCKLANRSLDADLIRIHTKRDQEGTRPSFLKYWQVPIRYGADTDAIHYRNSIADIIVKEVDGNTALTIFDCVRHEELSSSAEWRDRVLAVLESGLESQPQIAEKLGVSVATLRRRLYDENANFRDLKAQTLNSRSQQLLRSRQSLEDVAEQLGFADLRSFSRAFKAWNGITPKTHRMQITGGN